MFNDSISVTLCKLERFFTPSFFNSMEHLIVHLADEARIAGQSNIDGCTLLKVKN
ncbi:hypothetical protein OROHE_017139 [Orobanche hederae]